MPVTSQKEDPQQADALIRQLRQDLELTSAAEQALRAQVEELRTSRWRTEIRLEGRARQLERLLEIQEGTISALRSSKSWRITQPLRASIYLLSRTRNRLKALAKAMLPSGTKERAALRARLTSRSAVNDRPEDAVEAAYPEWHARYQQLSAEDIGLIEAQLASQDFPAVHVLWDLRSADEAAVCAATRSLQGQLHAKWTASILVSAAAEASAAVVAAIDTDRRLKCAQAISKTDLGEGLYLLLIDRAGELPSHALYLLLEAARRSPGSSVVLADEDEVAPAGSYHRPRLLSSYSPELPTTGSIALFAPDERDVRSDSDPFINGLPAAVHERVSGGETVKPARVPFIAFHAIQSPPLAGKAKDAMLLGGKDMVPFISIIIPTRDRFELMEPCISSILQKTDYPRSRYEIVVVDNGSTEVELITYLEHLVKHREIRLLKDPRSFNYARLNNLAVAATQGDLVAFVNNDVVVHDAAWLRRLAVHAIKQDVGAVGAKLLYPDMTIQHGGVVLGVQGVAAHAHHNLAATAPGYLGLSNTTHAISAVTGACLMMRRKLFETLGGFNEDLAVAFNDTLLCMDALSHGTRNIYVHQPLLIHYESKSRGLDDTDAKKALFRREARYARSKYGNLFKSDPYYSDNLSFERTYELAQPPRTFKPWHVFRRESTHRMRLLILSVTHQIGHGVPVVIDIHARHLAAEGHDVILGGPRGANDFSYPGCTRAYIETAQEAAVYAVQHGVDCVIMHTPPFFSTMRWLGPQVKTMVYDHGEPPPDLFPDADARSAELDEKHFCLEMADALYANSEATRDESGHDMMGVIPLGNTHLAQWDESMEKRREIARVELGFDNDTIVVLNVCRFHAGERYYKGIDEYCGIRDELVKTYPEIAERFVFALAGKGDQDDVAEMAKRGLRVFPNVTNEQMLNLYCCADVYANFSRWEGYNLGIGQALAMGLEVVASDIPVHRSFPIYTSSETGAQVSRMVELGLNPPAVRLANATPWEPSLQQITTELETLVLERRE